MFSFLNSLESLFLSNVRRELASRVAEASNSREYTCTLNTLGKASQNREVIFVVIFDYFCVYHDWTILAYILSSFKSCKELQIKD